MRFIRRHLGAWTFAWLSCQVAALTALLPVECYAAYQNLAVKTPDCLETTSEDACPMRGVDGDACPMHDGSNQADADEQCAMRGIHNGPAVALAALLSIPGVLLAETSAVVEQSASLVTPQAVRLSGAPIALDPPPPRS